jgi:hypothetical protein
MAIKTITNLVLSIKGRSWNFILLTDKTFNKLHGEENTAMTIFGDNEVHFRRSDWSKSAISHEIGHVLHSSSLTSSSELTVEQTAELFCEIIGEHVEEINLWATRVSERFLSVMV